MVLEQNNAFENYGNYLDVCSVLTVTEYKLRHDRIA